MAGLSALIVSAQPVFRAITWVGAGYLAFLAVRAARSAVRGGDKPVATRAASVGTGWRQGFFSTVTNPRVLLFYLAILPPFMAVADSFWITGPLALTHALVTALYLSLLVLAVDRGSAVLTRPRVRRTLDAITATVLGAFSVALVRSSA